MSTFFNACAGGAQGQQSSVIGAGADKPVSTKPVEGANTGNTEVLCLPTCPLMMLSGCQDSEEGLH